jgi:thioredoxin 1
MPFNPKHTDVEPTRAEIDATKGPLLVEFGAPWCGYCLNAQPMIERLMADFPDVRHIKIYDGKGRPLGRSFQVKLWPTLMFLRDGVVKHRAVRPSEQEILDGLRAITAT